MSERIARELEASAALDQHNLDVHVGRSAQYEIGVDGYGEAVLVLDVDQNGQLLFLLFCFLVIYLMLMLDAIVPNLFD